MDTTRQSGTVRRKPAATEARREPAAPRPKLAGDDGPWPDRARVVSFRPVPLQALTVTVGAAGLVSYTAIVRRWSPGEAARCRLCTVCTAKVGLDRQSVCVVAVEGPVPVGDDALYYSPESRG